MTLITAIARALKRDGDLDVLEAALPSGSGIDRGTRIDRERSRPDRIVLMCSFHHMNEHGYYDGWTDHEIIVLPSLAWGFILRVTGRDRNGIKDYLQDVYSDALREEGWP